MFIASFTITSLFFLIIGEVNTQINKLWKEPTYSDFIKTNETIVYLKCFSENECIYSTKSQKIYHYSSENQNLINISEPNFKGLSSVHKIDRNNKVIYFFCPLEGNTVCYSKNLKDIICFNKLSDLQGERTNNVSCFPDPINEKFHVIVKKEGRIYQIDYSNEIKYNRNQLAIGNNYIYHINFIEETIQDKNKKINQFLMVIHSNIIVSYFGINPESTSTVPSEIQNLQIEKLENKTDYNIKITFYLHKYNGLIAYNDKGNDFYQIVYTFQEKNKITIIYESNNLNVNIGKPYSIKNIKFMNDYSNYFYYYITAKDDENESYIGIIDIIYNVQLYHTKINSSSIGEIFTFNSDSFSLITDKGQKLCLFSMDKVCSKCIEDKIINVKDYIFCIKENNEDFCKENKQEVKNKKVFLIKETENGNENQCLPKNDTQVEKYKNVNGDYFFSDRCPALYTMLNNRSCSYCTNYYFYNKTNNQSQCLKECPNGYTGKYCIECKEAGLLIYKGKNFIDESGKKIIDGQCISNCPKYSEISNKECKYCKMNNMYYYDSEYSSNITNRILTKDDEIGKCI